MKKLFFALAFVLGMTGVASAQTKAKTTATTKTVSASTAPKKADGTLDMRYKKNKISASATGPKKADGTLDMRYRKNKIATKTTVKAKA